MTQERREEAPVAGVSGGYPVTQVAVRRRVYRYTLALRARRDAKGAGFSGRKAEIRVGGHCRGSGREFLLLSGVLE